MIDGSTLGGASIVRSLANTSKLNGLRATRFFSGYRNQTIARWRHVLEFVEATCAAGDASDAVDAAVSTFSAINRWLDHVSKCTAKSQHLT